MLSGTGENPEGREAEKSLTWEKGVTAMPGKSYRAGVFFSLHKAMRASAVRCGLRLPSWGEYCRAVYGWLREFSEDVERLEALDPELCAAYLNDLPNNGLVKLAENPRGFTGSYELAYSGSRKVFLEVSNTPAVRREAAEYLPQSAARRRNISGACMRAAAAEIRCFSLRRRPGARSSRWRGSSSASRARCSASL